jgi:hypothetical protein
MTKSMQDSRVYAKETRDLVQVVLDKVDTIDGAQAQMNSSICVIILYD